MDKNEEDVNEDIQVKEPSMYRVIMHNDDFTTQDFVMSLLTQVFNHNRSKAESLMMAVHLKGAATAGTFQHEIAELKVQISHERAMQEGFPFRLTMEEA